jgi:hypothetical protein
LYEKSFIANGFYELTMGTKSKSIALVLVALFLTSLITVIFVLPITASPVSTVQTLSNIALNGPIGIAVDSHNNPHIAYTERIANWSDYPSYGKNYVIYANWNREIWINQTAATDAAFIDMALDSHDNAHILFKSLGGMTDQHLMYAVWTGHNWNIQDTGAEGIYDASLALDSSDNPQIAFTDYNGETGNVVLKYASWSGSYWNTQIVDPINIYYICNLKLDSQNKPHIMYQTLKVSYNPYNSSEALKYATFNSTFGWVIQIVGQNIEFMNMVLDSDGYPHFSRLTEGGLTDTSWNGTAWNDKAINVAASDRSYIALDKQDNPYIESAGRIARWTGTAWDVRTVDNTSSIFTNGPIVVDSEGNPHMCYLVYGAAGGEAPYDLVYATTDISILTPSVPEFSLFVVIPLIVGVFAIAVILRHSLKTNPTSKEKA